MTQTGWIYMVTGTCLVLAAFLVWQEVRRASKARLVLRIAAVIVASVMLACLALPISYQSVAGRPGQQQIALLTEGYNADSVNNDGKIFTIDKAVNASNSKAVLLPGLDELRDTLKTQDLQVYGDGLNNDQLDRLNHVPIAFHKGKGKSGITNISWNAKLKAGETLRVQGSYQNTSAHKITLILKGLNTVLDTVLLKPNAVSNFELTSAPKSTGRLVYTLLAVTGGDTVLQGSIPLKVDAVKPLRVLILSASPDFETRFLKNWLSEKGYVIASRSAISKDKFNTDYINIPQFSLAHISRATLDKFDVVLGDLSVLNSLSMAEGAALKEGVADSGLGVIVRADSSGKTSWLQRAFPVTRPVNKETVSALLIAGKKSVSAKLTNGPAFVTYQNGTQPLVCNMQNHILAGSTLSGEGKMIFTTQTNTYTWVLGGNREDYASFWSALLSKAARQDTALSHTVEAATIPFADQPVKLLVSPVIASPIKINGQSVAPAQNATIPFQENIICWPAETGWQTFSQNNNVNWWYNYDAQEWKGVQASAKIAETEKYVSQQPIRTIVTKQIQQIVRIEVPKIYFYILLLAACTFLWIESKFL